jgi:hypothetical protein
MSVTAAKGYQLSVIPPYYIRALVQAVNNEFAS